MLLVSAKEMSPNITVRSAINFISVRQIVILRLYYIFLSTSIFMILIVSIMNVEAERNSKI